VAKPDAQGRLHYEHYGYTFVLSKSFTLVLLAGPNPNTAITHSVTQISGLYSEPELLNVPTYVDCGQYWAMLPPVTAWADRYVVFFAQGPREAYFNFLMVNASTAHPCYGVDPFLL